MKLAVIVLALLAASQATALVAESDAAKTLNCAAPEFPPYEFTEGNDVVGINIDVFRSILSAAGYTLAVSKMPWPRMLESLKEGSVDCMVAGFKTPEREEYIEFMKIPIYVATLVFFKNKETKHVFNSFSDIKGLQVTRLKGFSSGKSLDEMIAKKDVVEFQTVDFEQAFKMLSLNRTDLIAVNSDVGQYVVKKLNLGAQITTLEKPITVEPGYVGFTKKKNFSELINILDEKLFSNLIDGEYKKVLRKYVGGS